MQIDKTYKLEKIVSKDPSRPALQNVLVDEKEKLAVATDGRAMAFVPVQLDEEGNDEFINGIRMLPSKVVTEGRKASKQLSFTQIELNGGAKLFDGTVIKTEDEITYPSSWKQYLNQESKYTEGFTVTLNPKSLHSLAEALGSGDSVTLNFQDNQGCLDGLAPIRVTTGGRTTDPHGVLMPKRK